MIRSFVERLPIMICPRWVQVKAQPIAIEDLLAYLLAALELPTGPSQVYEIGGPDQVSYGQIMQEYAHQRGLTRWMIPVPLLTPYLSSLWLGLVTPLYARVGRKLVESLRNPTLISNNLAQTTFSIRPRSMRDSIQRALVNEDREFAETRWSDALSSAGKPHSWGGDRFGSRLVDSRTIAVAVPPEQAFLPIRRIGGHTGWYYANWLWSLRGFLDLLIGGVGVRRGRRDPDDLKVGDTVDCWRVESFEPIGVRRDSSPVVGDCRHGDILLGKIYGFRLVVGTVSRLDDFRCVVEFRYLENEFMTSASPTLAAPSPNRTSDQQSSTPDRRDRPDWLRLGALVLMHAGCLAVLWVGWSWTAVGLAVLLYLVRAFGLTAFYHRYFSHRAFKTSRWFQFVGGLLGCTALQKGPLWWAAHHREHHRSSDRIGDVHSPHVHGFIWSHMGWFLTPRNNELQASLIPNWMKFPELRWLDRGAPLIAILFAATLYGFGELLHGAMPGLRTDGWQLLVWGFFFSTVALYHATYSVNSLAHLFGSRRFATGDDSRNNWLVALLTLCEGWHNNHHHYPSSARQGFFWWEIDATYYLLVGLQRLGLVWGLRPVPRHVLRRELEL